MKIFLSYRYTGEDPTVLKSILDSICSSIAKNGYTTFCSFDSNPFFQDNSYSYKQILEYVFKELDTSDYVLAFVKSPEKSEGMLLELGYALAKRKKIILAMKKDVHMTFLPSIAEKVIEFEGFDELYEQLENIKLEITGT